MDREILCQNQYLYLTSQFLFVHKSDNKLIFFCRAVKVHGLDGMRSLHHAHVPQHLNERMDMIRVAEKA